MEPLVAAFLLALVRLGLGVSPQVLLEVAARGKTLGAEVAFERAAARVRSLMDHEIRLVAEVFAAYFQCLCFLAAICIVRSLHAVIVAR